MAYDDPKTNNIGPPFLYFIFIFEIMEYIWSHTHIFTQTTQAHLRI